MSTRVFGRTAPALTQSSRFALLLATILVLALSSCGGSAPPRASGGKRWLAAAGDAVRSTPGRPDFGEGVKTWKRSSLEANSTRLWVGDRETLPLQSLQAQVRVEGFRARVVLDYLFLNDQKRSLEGNFQIRLPNDASPYFFAFGEDKAQPTAIAASPTLFSATEVRSWGVEPQEILQSRATSWTLPKEARIVPQPTAAFAYSTVVQQRVDPALLEWAGAGVFNARVFPLQPDRRYRVVLGYDVDLVSAGDALEFSFDIPAGTHRKVVDVRAAAVPDTEIVWSPAVGVETVGTRQFARFDNPSVPRITLRYRRVGATLLTGTDSVGSPHFATRFLPVLPTRGQAQTAPTAIFLVDTSLSSSPDRFNVWLKLLQAILDNNRQSLQQFAVLFFNVEQHWWRPDLVSNTPENVRVLLQSAGFLALEGATDLGAALSAALEPSWATAKGAKPDLFLLSDGAPTWGEAETQVLAKLVRDKGGSLFAYSTGLEGTDSPTLELLARESGGAVFSVVGEAEIDSASKAHRVRPFRLLEVVIPGASDVLVAGRPRVLYPGQRLQIVGRGTPRSEVALKLEGDKAPVVVRTALAPAVDSELASRAYGQVAVAQLEELGGQLDGLARAYSLGYRVTGRTCALLMLESEEDYARFSIEPTKIAEAIRKNPASPALQQALLVLGQTLGDPKENFLRWVQELQYAPGMTFRLNDAFLQMLKGLPAQAFVIEPSRLECQQRNRSQLPEDYVDALLHRSFDYDRVTGEAERRRQQSGAADGLKALSTLLEQNPGDAVLARDVGFSALEWGLSEHAYHLFRRVARSRPFEPQNYRAMAQALAAVKKTDLAMALYEIAQTAQFDHRFGDFRLILAVDYLRFLRRIAAGDLATSAPEFARSRLESLSRVVNPPEAELVVMITWNTDGTDIDLHVKEPSGEECFYRHPKTASGGKLTRDVTQGYGPEMYVLPKLSEGTYFVRVHYYNPNRMRGTTRTKVYATIFENWGTPNERVTERVLKLEKGKEYQTIATIEGTRN